MSIPNYGNVRKDQPHLPKDVSASIKKWQDQITYWWLAFTRAEKVYMATDEQLRILFGNISEREAMRIRKVAKFILMGERE